MSEKKQPAKGVERAYKIYEVEGHGYAVESYIHDVESEDPELNELWKNASESMIKLTKYFNDKVESEELECLQNQ